MKLRNLLRSPHCFNFSDGKPIHFSSRELISGLPEEYRKDPQVTRRERRGILRVYDESPKASPKKETRPKPKPTTPKKKSSGGDSRSEKSPGEEGEVEKTS